MFRFIDSWFRPGPRVLHFYYQSILRNRCFGGKVKPQRTRATCPRSRFKTFPLISIFYESLVTRESQPSPDTPTLVNFIFSRNSPAVSLPNKYKFVKDKHWKRSVSQKSNYIGKCSNYSGLIILRRILLHLPSPDGWPECVRNDDGRKSIVSEGWLLAIPRNTAEEKKSESAF